MVEQVLEDYARAYGLHYVVLRYFNAAGAYERGEIGEDHDPETHLIPIILQHLLGIRESISVFGSDYPTEDGTCIRDYIHVTDLAKAHILALDALLCGKKETATYNLGTAIRYSLNNSFKPVKNNRKKQMLRWPIAVKETQHDLSPPRKKSSRN